MKNITNVVIFISMLTSIVSCNVEAPKDLLSCDKPWNERTEFEKIIGVWCGEIYKPGVGRTSTSQDMGFQTKMFFYSDRTMKEVQVSHSWFNSESEMESGTNVKVENGVLTYTSDKYDEKSFVISVSQSSLTIDGMIAISMNDTFTKCSE